MMVGLKRISTALGLLAALASAALAQEAAVNHEPDRPPTPWPARCDRAGTWRDIGSRSRLATAWSP